MPLVKVRHHTETERRWTRGYVGLAWLAELGNGVIQTITGFGHILSLDVHPAFKRQDRLGKEPFAGFGTVVEDIKRSGYTKNQPILLGAF